MQSVEACVFGVGEGIVDARRRGNLALLWMLSGLGEKPKAQR